MILGALLNGLAWLGQVVLRYPDYVSVGFVGLVVVGLAVQAVTARRRR